MATINGSDVEKVVTEALSKHFGKKLGAVTVMVPGGTEGYSLASVTFSAPETGSRKGRKPGAKAAPAPSAVPAEPAS